MEPHMELYRLDLRKAVRQNDGSMELDGRPECPVRVYEFQDGSILVEPRWGEGQRSPLVARQREHQSTARGILEGDLC